MKWFERYQEQVRALANEDTGDFVEELIVAAEEFLVQAFNAEMDAWATKVPEGF